MTYETGEYQNRGFLNMPICPIEGFGVIIMVVFFREIKDTYLLLFLASTAVCTAFELFVGWGMEKLFHARWWDYSHMKYNFKGFICLRNSLFFGFGCVICIHFVQPWLEMVIDRIPVRIGQGFVLIMSVLIAIDTVISLLTVKKLNEKIKRVDEISKLMLAGSVKVGMKLASGTLKVKSGVDNVSEKVSDVRENVSGKVSDVRDSVVEKMTDVKVSVAEKVSDIRENVADYNSANMEKLKSEYERLLSEKDAATERLLKAFPRMKSLRYSEALAAIKEKAGVRISRKPVNTQKDLPAAEEEKKEFAEKL